MDPLNEISIEPNIVRSVAKALQLNGMQSNLENTASNTNSIKTNTQAIINNTNSLKTDLALIHSDLQTTNQLLQQLVDK